MSIMKLFFKRKQLKRTCILKVEQSTSREKWYFCVTIYQYKSNWLISELCKMSGQGPKWSMKN